MNEKLNEANFLIYAMHHYDNTQCYSLAEFEDDLKKFLYLKKLISRYKNNGDLKERLILNHIRMPEHIVDYGITLSEVVLDERVISTLRKI